MQKKFNIALVPVADNAGQFIEYARNTFNIKADTYLLGEQSHPHVTLCHFAAEESDITDITGKMLALQQPQIYLTFNTRRSKTYPADSAWGQWSWVSLMPDKLDELKELHLKIAEFVTPLNQSFAKYDPHLTLFNSVDKDACNKINETPNVHPALSSHFNLMLGTLDNAGQITKLLF